MGISDHLDDIFFFSHTVERLLFLKSLQEKTIIITGYFVGFVHALDIAPDRCSDTVRKAFFPEAV